MIPQAVERAIQSSGAMQTYEYEVYNEVTQAFGTSDS